LAAIQPVQGALKASYLGSEKRLTAASTQKAMEESPPFKEEFSNARFSKGPRQNTGAEQLLTKHKKRFLLAANTKCGWIAASGRSIRARFALRNIGVRHSNEFGFPLQFLNISCTAISHSASDSP
jgi:hypothetical protein